MYFKQKNLNLIFVFRDGNFFYSVKLGSFNGTVHVILSDPLYKKLHAKKLHARLTTVPFKPLSLLQRPFLP